MNTETKKYILNLVDSLRDELRAFFESREIEILNRSEVSDMSMLDYILVSSSADAVEASKDFAAGKNNIEIVCFGAAEAVQDFLIYDGRFIIHPEILQSELGEIVLDNFFSPEKSIHLSENFGEKFHKVANFEVTNHMAVGESFDQACSDAFKTGFNLLSLRTYLDHSLYFLTYLKQSGSGGVPFTYEYSNSSDVFCLNIHLNVQEFFAEYLFDSFGEFDLSSPQKYLLSVLKNSCDYLDICYVEKPGKLVLTAMWDKSGEKTLKGIGFHKIETASKQVQNSEKRIQHEYDFEKSLETTTSTVEVSPLPGKLLDPSFVIAADSILNEELEEIISIIVNAYSLDHPGRELSKVEESDIEKYLSNEMNSKLTSSDRAVILEAIRNTSVKKLMKDKLEVTDSDHLDDQEFQEELVNISTDVLAEEVSRNVKANSLEEFLESTLVKGRKDEIEESIIIGGKDIADDFKQTVKGTKDSDIDSFAQHFSSSLTEKEPFKIIPGSKDKDVNSLMTNWVVKSLSGSPDLKNATPAFKGYMRDKLPQMLESELANFAKSLDKNLEDLSDEEIQRFKTEHLAGVFKELFQNESTVDEFADKVSKSSSLDFEKMDVRDPKLNNFANELKSNLIQKIKSLGSDIPVSEMQQALKNTIKEKIAQIYHNNSLSLPEKEERKTLLIKEMAETLNMSVDEVKAIVNEGVSKSDEAVAIIVENKKQNTSTHKSAIDAQFTLKLKKLEEENKRLKDNLRITQLQNEAKVGVAEKIEELKIKSLLSDEEIAGLNDNDNPQHLEIRKLELEANKKEIVFAQELERTQKALKAKDFVVQKAKEAMKIAIDRKESELDAMKTQVHSLSQKLQGGTSSNQSQELIRLKSEKENLIKTSEIYKNKLEAMARHASKNMISDDSVQIAEENRTLKQIKINLERQAEESLRRSKRLEERFQKANNNEIKTKVEYKTVESQLKGAQLQLRRLKEQISSDKANAEKLENAQNEQLLKDFDHVKSQNLSLSEAVRVANAKISELTEQTKLLTPKDVDPEALSDKHQLEVKRLNSELEIVRQEKITLQKKITEIAMEDKDLEKDQLQANKSAVDPVKQRLERSVKKLNSEMMKAMSESNERKIEAMKAKKEVMGLKNQMAVLKKELEKAKKQVELNSKKAA